MNPFKFRLQTLLRMRIADRDEKRAKLAEAYQAEQILQTRIDDLTREIAGGPREHATGVISGGNQRRLAVADAPL